jgi:hypothetical protein
MGNVRVFLFVVAVVFGYLHTIWTRDGWWNTFLKCAFLFLTIWALTFIWP